MRYSNIILILVAVAILGLFSYWQLTKSVEHFNETEHLPVDANEYVWIRADSLSLALTKYSRGNIEIDSSRRRSYTITYAAKKYLFHETIEYADSLRKHLTSKENVELLYDYEETDAGVKISLKRKDDYVFCPAMIVAWILREKNEDVPNSNTL